MTNEELFAMVRTGFATLASLLILQGANFVNAAEPSTVEPKYLHDGENTVNPWSRDEKRLKDYRVTISNAKDYIQRDPSDPTNYLNRCEAYLHLMQPKEALVDANKALALKPKAKSNLSSAYRNRGEALLQLKQDKPALDDLNKACSLDPENGEAFYFRGMAKEKLGQLPQAIKDYEIAYNLGFSIKEIQVDLSAYMREVERKIKNHWHPPKSDTSKQVIAVFKVARDGSVSHLKILEQSGVAGLDAASIAAVQQAAPFAQLPKGAPKVIDIQFCFEYNVKGSGSGGRAGVVSFLERVTEKWNNAESEAYNKLTAAKNGKDETAVYDAELKLAKIYTDRGKYPAAIELFQSALKALEKKPDKLTLYGKTFGHLAIVYSLQGKTAEAETEFKKSLDILDQEGGRPSDPEVAEILKEYGKVLYKAKKIDEANKIFARLKT